MEMTGRIRTDVGGDMGRLGETSEEQRSPEVLMTYIMGTYVLLVCLWVH